MSEIDGDKFIKALDALMGALEPFAEFAESEGLEGYDDDQACTIQCGGLYDRTLVLGDFREAVYALETMFAVTLAEEQDANDTERGR